MNSYFSVQLQHECNLWLWPLHYKYRSLCRLKDAIQNSLCKTQKPSKSNVTASKGEQTMHQHLHFSCFNNFIRRVYKCFFQMPSKQLCTSSTTKFEFTTRRSNQREKLCWLAARGISIKDHSAEGGECDRNHLVLLYFQGSTWALSTPDKSLHWRLDSSARNSSSEKWTHILFCSCTGWPRSRFSLQGHDPASCKPKVLTPPAASRAFVRHSRKNVCSVHRYPAIAHAHQLK
jgi:hypothetical protein